MNHILYIRYIKTSRSNISANKYHALFTRFSLLLLTKLNSSTLDLLNSRTESIQIFKSLALLHFTVQALIFHLQELKHIAHSFRASDRVAENYSRFTFPLLQVVIKIQVFFFFTASYSKLLQSVGHSLFLSKIDNFRVSRSKFQNFTELLNS